MIKSKSKVITQTLVLTLFVFTNFRSIALTLGRAQVISPIGSPIRVEIELENVPNLANVSQIQAVIASRQAFQREGLDFHPVVSGLKVNPSIRADGKPVLQIVGNQPFKDSFLDLILEVNDGTSQIQRDYTLLFSDTQRNIFSTNSSASINNFSVPSGGKNIITNQDFSTFSSETTYSDGTTSSQQTARKTYAIPGYYDALPNQSSESLSQRNLPAPILVEPLLPRTAAVNPPPVQPIQQVESSPKPSTTKAQNRTNNQPDQAFEEIVRFDAPDRVVRPSASQSASLDTPDKKAPLGASDKKVVPATPAKKRASSTSSAQLNQSYSQEGLYTVQRGDTLSTIALKFGLGNASLTQMLYAITVANKEKFTHGNMNLIQAGAEIVIPSSLEAAQVDIALAEALFAEHARAFNAYRQGLSSDVVASIEGNTQSSASGTVSPVDEKTTIAPEVARDVLTIKRATVASDSIANELIEKEFTQKEQELQTLKEAIDAVSDASIATTQEVTSISDQPTEASTATSEQQTQTIQSQQQPNQVQPPQEAKDVKDPVVGAESFLSSLLNSFVLKVGAILALVLFVVIGIFQYIRSLKYKRLVKPTFDSRLSSDSFFAVSGGQRVDTSLKVTESTMSDQADGPPSRVPLETASAMYSPRSQIDSDGNDIDAIAEAEVYLAYGKHDEAERILNDHLKSKPKDIDAMIKLLEIYVQRNNVINAESLVNKIKLETQGEGRWEDAKALAMKLKIIVDDFSNRSSQATLAQMQDDASGVTNSRVDFSEDDSFPLSPASSFNTNDQVEEAESQENSTQDEEGNIEVPDIQSSHANQQTLIEVEKKSFDFDFDEEEPEAIRSESNEEAANQPQEQENLGSDDDVDFSFGDSLNADDASMIDVDDDSEKHVDSPEEQPSDSQQYGSDLQSKIELAIGCRDIGDHETARALLEEVISQGNEAEKQKAEEIISTLQN